MHAIQDLKPLAVLFILLCAMVSSEGLYAQPKPDCGPGFTYTGGRWLAQFSPDGRAGHWVGGRCTKIAPTPPAPAPPATVVAHWTPGKYGIPVVPNFIGFGVIKILLSDGTVMAQVCTNPVTCGVQWMRLTPDAKGKYANGTWSRLSDSNFERTDYASAVLTDGRVFFVGGEYTNSKQQGEIYDPTADKWTVVGKPPSTLFASNEEFLDSESMLLPNGSVLFDPVKNAGSNNTIIYDPLNNQWVAGAQFPSGRGQDEATWVKLPDDSIIVPDPDNVHSDRYFPAQNTWVDDGLIPTNAQLYKNGEMGPGFLLPNGNALFFGGTGNTAIYSPPTGTATIGSWTAGPNIPNPTGGTGVAADVAGAIMPNGKIVITVGTNALNGGSQPPGYFYEFDPFSPNGGSFRRISAPTGDTTISFSPGNIGYLVLPDGTVMANSGDNKSGVAYFYGPNGPAVKNAKPTIASISKNADGSFHLVGTRLNGFAAGASFGDDAQMNSNYPIVRLTNHYGVVYFGRTYNWSSTGVQTGTKVISTEFRLPSKIGYNSCGKYSLVVIANGISSDPFTFSPGNC